MDEQTKVQPGILRVGWRSFECGECDHKWEWPSRDRFSPSGEDCPKCGEWCTPRDNRPDASLPTDKHGNLTVPWNHTPTTNKDNEHGQAEV